MKTLFLFLALALVSPLMARHTGATIILLPKTWDGKSPLPVAIWLHGRGADPTLGEDTAWHQETADRLGLAIVGIAATRRLAADSYEWTGKLETDYKHIEQALAAVAKAKKVTFSRKMFYGFSQGGTLAAELAARHPDEFAGGIVLSPGCRWTLPPLTENPGIARQTFFVSCGQLEAEGNVLQARYYARRLRELGATTQAREVPGDAKHHWPTDFKDRFPEWVAAILKL